MSFEEGLLYPLLSTLRSLVATKGAYTDSQRKMQTSSSCLSSASSQNMTFSKSFTLSVCASVCQVGIMEFLDFLGKTSEKIYWHSPNSFWSMWHLQCQDSREEGTRTDVCCTSTTEPCLTSLHHPEMPVLVREGAQGSGQTCAKTFP